MVYCYLTNNHSFTFSFVIVNIDTKKDELENFLVQFRLFGIFEINIFKTSDS